LVQIGSAWTSFTGTTSDDLKKAITTNTTVAQKGKLPTLKEIGYLQITLGLIWGFSATPRQVIRRITKKSIQ